jgi:SpoVK/Ycf46/Vps4 family AAA+-type ATPase
LIINESQKHNRPSVNQDDDDEEEYQEEPSESDLDSVGESVTENNNFIATESEEDVQPKRRGRPRRSYQKKLRNLRNSLSYGTDEDKERRSSSPPRRKHLRQRKEINYQILPPPPLDEPMETIPDIPKRKAQIPFKQLFKTSGPFGRSGLAPIFGRSTQGNELKAAGGVADSDSSDDDLRAKPVSSNPVGAPPLIKGKNNLADSDPLGIDTNIDFSVVGGLDSYIDQLKEMVSLPLQYPEVYQRFGVTPPRGVLFHGPPGTGKTLMARALAASCSTEGRKVTFFMRKGADCLSKWVGEAERQLRLLFEEAKNQQPSIIFFDEIDGLAPVRSSKQEQIHASIVSTLLALMDGMDNRGQVIVIGATNRPDSVDSALRRPGRFDREFYFPLPDLDARKKIISIHTRKWDPPLQENFIEHIARVTKGYGGADLRALCTEAALAAIQRRYPQIYQSKEKLLIDPSTIHVSASDFMKSVEKIIPSSARSTSSGAAPLPSHVQPLLQASLNDLIVKLDNYIPRKKKITPLEEALLEDYNDVDNGFSRLEASREFQASRVFRPRMLVYGDVGMGQQYIGAALLHHLEGYHIQSFDLGTLLSDSTRTPEAMIIQLLVEVKRHTPSVIFIPNLDSWLDTISPTGKSTFFGFLRNLKPTDSILVLALAETKDVFEDFEINDLFGYSGENLYEISGITLEARENFFDLLVSYIKNKPTDFIESEDRPKRVLEKLPLAPPDADRTIIDSKQLRRKDMQVKNKLKIKLSAIMDPIKTRYKKFKKPIIDLALLYHILYPTPQLNIPQAYEKTDDDMILDIVTGRKYYNMDLDVIEERLWNGYYCEPKQFLADIKMIHYDSLNSGDRERIVRSSEMLTNAQVYIDEISTDFQFIEDCKNVHRRELEEGKRLSALIPDEKGVIDLSTNGNVNDALPNMQNTNTNEHVLAAASETVVDVATANLHTGGGEIAVSAAADTLKNEALSVAISSTVTNTEVSMADNSAIGIEVDDIKGPDGEHASFATALAKPVENYHPDLNSFESGVKSDARRCSTFPVSPKITQLLAEGEEKAIEEKGAAIADHSAAVPTEEVSQLNNVPSSLLNGEADAMMKSESNINETVDHLMTAPSIRASSGVTLVSKEEVEKEIEAVSGPELILDESLVSKFKNKLVTLTDGLSVERLEQINSMLIDLLWKQRHLWNRNTILELLDDKLTKVITLIKESDTKRKERFLKASASF